MPLSKGTARNLFGAQDFGHTAPNAGAGFPNMFGGGAQTEAFPNSHTHMTTHDHFLYPSNLLHWIFLVTEIKIFLVSNTTFRTWPTRWFKTSISPRKPTIHEIRFSFQSCDNFEIFVFPLQVFADVVWLRFHIRQEFSYKTRAVTNFSHFVSRREVFSWLFAKYLRIHSVWSDFIIHYCDFCRRQGVCGFPPMT